MDVRSPLSLTHFVTGATATSAVTMNILPLSDRFTPLPVNDPVIIAPHDMQLAKFRIPPTTTQQQSLPHLEDHDASDEDADEQPAPHTSSATARATKSSNKPLETAPKRRRNFIVKAPTSLRDYLKQLQLHCYFPIGTETKVSPVTYQSIATGTTKKKPDLISTAVAVREMEKKTKAASKPRPRKAQKNLKGVRGTLPQAPKSALSSTAMVQASPWSNSVHLYRPTETSLEMYLQLIEADKYATGIDQIFGRRHNPLKPVLVLNNIAPNTDILASHICMVSLMFWLYIRKRFLAYRPDLFQAEYSESYPQEIFLLHLSSDFHFTLKDTEKPWHETGVQMDQLAIHYSYADFAFIVMSIVKHKYGPSMNNAAEFEHSRWCDNNLQRNHLLTLVSRKFAEMKISNLLDVCNFAIKDRFGNNTKKILQIKTNRWYPQRSLMSQKVLMPPSMKSDIHIPTLLYHHWFCSSHPVLTDYTELTELSYNPKDYHGAETCIRQWLWELSFIITETVRSEVKTQFGHLIQREIQRLTKVVAQNECTLQLLQATNEAETAEQLRCEQENKEAAIASSRLHLFRKSELLVGDDYPGARYLNFIRMRYSHFNFNNALYYAPPWTMIRPTFVADEHSLSYLNRVKVSCMINNGVDLRLTPRCYVDPMSDLDDLIVHVKRLPGITQHNTRGLHFERFREVGTCYRGLLMPRTCYESQAIDPRWVPITDTLAYLSLHDDHLDREHEQLVKKLLETQTTINPLEAYDYYRALCVFGLHENDIIFSLAQRMGLQEDPEQVALALQYSYEMYKQSMMQRVPGCMALHEPSLKASLSKLVASRDLEQPMSLRAPLLSLLLNNYSVTSVLQTHLDQGNVKDEEEGEKLKPVLSKVPQFIVSNILRYTLRFLDTPTSLLPTVHIGNVNNISPEEVELISQEIAKQLVTPLRVQVKILTPTLGVPLPAGRKWQEPDADDRLGVFDKALAHVTGTLRKAVRNTNFKQDVMNMREGASLCGRELATMQLLMGVLDEASGDQELKQHVTKIITKHKVSTSAVDQRKPPIYYECMRILVSSLDNLDTVPKCVWDSLWTRFSADARTTEQPIHFIRELIEEVTQDRPNRKRAIRTGMQSSVDHELVKVLLPPITPVRPQASTLPLNNKRTRAEVVESLHNSNMFIRKL